MSITKPVVPDESDNLSRTELADTAQRYAREVQETYHQSPIFDIELARVDWKVSPQLCRAGAYCETLLDDPPEHTIGLSYPGYRSWGWDRMKGIIRHELVHLVINEEYEDGVTAHGPEFQSVAESVDAPLRGEDPVPYRYQLYCSYCGAMVDGLYKASDRTQNPEEYQSPCCETSLTVETNSDWPGYVTE
jgi:predicted SprT family Zn-dependent metalloprotease